MSNEINIQLDPFLETGLTLVAKVFNKTGAQQDSDVSLSETSTGFYTGDFDLSGLADGDYIVKFQTATEFYGSGKLKVKDGVEVELSNKEEIANAVELSILDDADGNAILQAIVDAIGNENIDEIALVAAIRADLERAGGSLDSIPLLAEIESSTVLAKESTVSALNNVSITEVEVAAANALNTYDAPTKAELDTAQSAIESDIAALNNISTADIRTELSTELANLDVAVSTRLANADYTAPDNAGISAIQAITDQIIFTSGNINAIANVVEDKTGYTLTTADKELIATAVEASLLDENDGQKILEAIVNAIGNQNIDEIALVAAIRADLERAGGSIDALPLLSEIESSTVLAKEATLAALNDIDTAQVQSAAAAALTAYDAPTKAELDTAQSAIESDIAALNNLNTSDVQTAAAAALTAYDAPTKAELDTAQSSIESNIAALNNLNTSDVQSAAAAALTAYDAPTKAELDTAQTSIESNIAALNNLDSAQVQSAAAAALTAYDAPTKAELDTAQTSIENIVNALNNISIAEVENTLTNYGAATTSDVTGSTGTTQDSLVIINEGVKKASLLIPHTEDL